VEVIFEFEIFESRDRDWPRYIYTCGHLRVRFEELTASLEASNLPFASASRSLREASASIAANCYDWSRQEGQNEHIPASA
jgi:hypothetical protein